LFAIPRPFLFIGPDIPIFRFFDLCSHFHFLAKLISGSPKISCLNKMSCRLHIQTLRLDMYSAGNKHISPKIHRTNFGRPRFTISPPPVLIS
jgi:hypothetical protein